MARFKRAAVLCCSASMRQPLLSTRCQSSMRQRRPYQRRHSQACSTDVISRVLNKSHSRRSAPGGGQVFAHVHHPQPQRCLARVMLGGAEHDLAVAQLHLRGALRMARARLLLALLGSAALARHRDGQAALGRTASGLVEQAALLGDETVVLGAHQQVDLVALSLLVEQLEEVGLAVHHADHPGLGHARRGLLALAQPVDPVKGLLVLDRHARCGSLLIGAYRRRLQARIEHAQRQALAGERQRGVQVA